MSESDHEKLGSAAESLRSAETLVQDGEVEAQIGSEADHLSDLAGREKAPDQERVSGHRHTLRELHGKVRDDDARAHISRALDHVTSVQDAI